MTKEDIAAISKTIVSLRGIMCDVDQMSGRELRKCHDTRNNKFQNNADLMMDAVGYIECAIEHLEELLTEEE